MVITNAPECPTATISCFGFAGSVFFLGFRRCLSKNRCSTGSPTGFLEALRKRTGLGFGGTARLLGRFHTGWATLTSERTFNRDLEADFCCCGVSADRCSFFGEPRRAVCSHVFQNIVDLVCFGSSRTRVVVAVVVVVVVAD